MIWEANKKILLLIIIGLVLSNVLMPSTVESFIWGRADETIYIGIYKAWNSTAHISAAVPLLLKALDGVKWRYKGRIYEFKASVLEFRDIIKGELDRYDTLVFPGNGYYFLESFLDNFYNNRWKDNIRKFVENGGGYVGTCGAAIMACQNPVIGWPFIKTLGIVNLYAYETIFNEAQYYLQDGLGIPVLIHIKYSLNPIFKGFYGSLRSINYFGGPAFLPAHKHDRKYGRITVLATYATEPSEIAPIHRQPILGGGLVKTNLEGKYAAIATTYGKGRVVLFGPHPELWSWRIDKVLSKNASRIEEGINARGKWYRWKEGLPIPNYNMWIVKRSIAWTVGKLGLSEITSRRAAIDRTFQPQST
ncbi:MAG TPA: hypothetical protein ENG38_02080 [Thermoplasmatales archaeon]|nr:hypothetical protein [Thermoplasmatales archaeon]HEX08581.1 hypothetical protein [Thermoplasmatales archaeon]